MDYRWTRWLSLVTNTLISYWSPSWKSRLTFWPGFWPITSAVKLLSPRLSCWAELFALLYNLYRQVNTHLSLKFLTCNLQRYEHFWLITKTSVNYKISNTLISIIYSRFIELSTIDSVHGREMVHYDVLLDDLHLHSGTVSYKLETLPPWNLQHDWPHGVNIVTANSSFGESTTTRMYIA